MCCSFAEFIHQAHTKLEVDLLAAPASRVVCRLGSVGHGLLASMLSSQRSCTKPSVHFTR